MSMILDGFHDQHSGPEAKALGDEIARHFPATLVGFKCRPGLSAPQRAQRAQASMPKLHGR